MTAELKAWVTQPDAFPPPEPDWADAGIALGTLHPNGDAGGDYPLDGRELYRGTLQTIARVRRRLCGQRRDEPLIWCDLDRLRCSYYAPRLPPGTWLQEGAYWAPLGLLNDVRFRSRGDRFVRPDAGDKPFTGQVVRSGYEAGDLEIIRRQAPPETLCVVADAQEVTDEYRAVVRERIDGGCEVVTGCRYGSPTDDDVEAGLPDDVADFLRDVMEGFHGVGDPMFVADAARLADGRVKVLELNGLSTSGLYACDARAIVDAAKAAVRDWYA
ncbi:ATP-grasp domain-containing protein [Alienimonas sp. DA493]|uniref:ATP-grasp domain-containing protein n=1 Tax=Alienimonas sp. DA493 TaxID=3373605 RepID=UPI0037548493